LLIPIGTATPTPQDEPIAFNPAQIREFTPQNYDLSNNVSLINLTFLLKEDEIPWPKKI
jgi:hypothetical protein